MEFESQSFTLSNNVLTAVRLLDTDAGPNVANEDFLLPEGRNPLSLYLYEQQITNLLLPKYSDYFLCE